MKNTVLLPVYPKSNISFEYGEGAYLFSIDGKKYLDFAAGVAVNSLGHSHPALLNALRKQSEKIWHISNVHDSAIGKKFATALTSATFADLVFFCNSGAEALEAGIKIIRNYQYSKGFKDKYNIITFDDAFHGRSIATVSASGKTKHFPQYAPYLEGFVHAKFNDIESVKALIDEHTAGIMVELIQGEGGVNVADPKFIKELRNLADKHDLVLMFDEVQTGVGRTGALYEYQNIGVEPDVLTSAKGLGGGYPIGACLTTNKFGLIMQQGTHGSTYGGNPLAMAVGSAVLNIVNDKKFLNHVQKMGELFKEKIAEVQKLYPNIIAEVKGKGLMLGLKFNDHTAKEVVDKFREIGLLTVTSSNDVIRVVPPLIIEEAHVNEAIDKIRTVCKMFAAMSK